MLGLINKQHKAIIVVSILSITGESFLFEFGAQVKIIHFIGFLMLPFILNRKLITSNGIVKYVLKPFWIEFIYVAMLGVVIGLMFPWEDLSGVRSWAQQSQGRTIIQTVRIFNELIVFYYIVWVIWKEKVSVSFIIWVVGITSVAGVLIAIIDFYNGYNILSLLAKFREDLAGRFIGLNGEPKGLGRNSAVSYGILLVYYITRNRDRRIILLLILLALGVLISLSASSIVLFIGVNIAIVLIYFKGSLNWSLVLVASLIFIGFFQLKVLDSFNEFTSKKIEKAVLGNEDIIISNEPEVFTRFDIFDRLALNFLYNNVIYAVIGTGPNLISIPASNYIPRNSWAFKENRIDSVPNLLVNNIVSRSGFIGLSILMIGFYRVYKVSKLDSSKFELGVLTVSTLFAMVYFNVVLFFYLGVLIGDHLVISKKISIVD